MGKELEELRRYVALLEESYNNLTQWYEERDRLYHDFKNHVVVLSQLLREEEWGKALSYAEGIEKPLKRIEKLTHSGSRAVDMILNEKMGKAAALGVELTADCDPLPPETLSDMDWCVILGNLLDNALEAGCACGERGWIRLEIRRKNRILLIHVYNSYAEPPKIRHGKFLTGKSDGLHGIGMKSVQAAVRKNDGIVEWEYDEKRFAVHITLFL